MDIKTIAFYLPQFHPIPENDEAYGKGFTEWTNVKKATPLFDGHNQPRVPLNHNYYSLLDVNVMVKQAKMARENGIYGFCYYHYWFKNGRKLLEKPIEMMLKDERVNIPFCLCWANENWTKRWDGGDNSIIVSQDYSMKEIPQHVDYLCRFFSDKRYIKIHGKPVLLIYRPELIPRLKKYIGILRNEIKKHGFPGVILMCQYPNFYLEGKQPDVFDNYIQFQPAFIGCDIANRNMSVFIKLIRKSLILFNMRKIGRKLFHWMNGERKLEIRSYDSDWEEILRYKVTDKKLIAGAFVDWDNTPRNIKGLLYEGTTPDKFGRYFKRLTEKVKNEYKYKWIFINAWNEWAEGCYLEPDEKNKDHYLKNVFRVLQN